MNKIDFEALTPAKLANSCEGAVNMDRMIAYAGTLAFAGKVLKAPTGSLLHGAFLELIKRRNAWNKKVKEAGVTLDDATKYQGINQFSMSLRRWLKTDARHQQRRISLKATGSDPCIALVKNSNNPSTKSEKGKTARKGSVKTTPLQGVKDLNAGLDVLIDAYGIEAVKLALAKKVAKTQPVAAAA